jgi:hypothetical protein
LQAGRQLREVVPGAAALLLQMKPEALEIRDGLISACAGGSPSISLPELIYTDEGQLTNGTFADYFLPVAADLPDIVVPLLILKALRRL